MKKLAQLLAVISLVFIFSGCNDEGETDKKVQSDQSNTAVGNESAEPETGNTGVIEEALSATLKEVADQAKDGEKAFLYEVSNNTDEIFEIPFSENGGFSYIVRDDAGEEVSNQTDATTIETNQGISPGESLSTTIILYGYEAGTYELEVWLVSDLDNSYNQTILFTVE